MISINTSKAQCLIFTILLQIYYIQDYLGITGLAKFLLIIILVFSIYKTYYVIKNYKLEPVMKSLTWFFALITAYGLAHLLFGKTHFIKDFWITMPVPRFLYLKYIFLSIPIIYVYYDFAKKGAFNHKSILHYSIILLVFAIIAFLSYYTFGNPNETSLEYDDGVTNNMGYKFIPIIPMLFLVKKWRLPLISVCIVFIILSLKRGAIISGFISIMFYILLILKENKGRKKLFIVPGIIILLLGGSSVLINYYESSQGLQKRLEQTVEGDTSGRDVISKTIINYYINHIDTKEAVFGNGADASIDVAGNYAHNDWLELLINQGIIGVLFYISFFIYWLKDWLKIRHVVSPDIFYAFGLALTTTFLSTIYSMSYTNLSAGVSIVIGYCLYRQQLNIKIYNASGLGNDKRCKKNSQIPIQNNSAVCGE